VAIERKLERTGIFRREVTHATGDDALVAVRDLAEHTVESDIEGMRRAAAEYLSELGYDTDWPECLKIPSDGVDPIVRDCREMLFYAHATLDHLSNGDARGAIWCAMRLTQHHTKAGLRQWEPLAVSGQKSAIGTDKSNKARKESAKAKYAKWQRTYEKLKKINPKLNKSDGARKIVEEEGGNFDHIRHHLT
jgi:hypothetical protein